MKRILLALLVLTLIGSAVYAQDAESVGIDTICGASALTITANDQLPEDAGTQALDLVLHQFVQMPSDAVPLLSLTSIKPPAPGAVIFVDSPGNRYFRSIGVTDVESCSPVDPTIPFPIGSNTKMFTAAVIYQLHEEGLLSTSDLVSQYLPEEIALWEGADAITIDMLLGHTSGLPDYLNSQDPNSVGMGIMNAVPGVLERAFTPEELVANAAPSPMLFEPGAAGQWAYSNTGYIMLGQIIEQVTGKSYVEAVTERIIQPLGLEHTVILNDVAPADLGLASQYLTSPFTRNTSGWNYSQAWSAGSGISTPEDMAIFLRAYYTGALYQQPETLEAMMTRAAPGYALESDNFYYMHGGYYKAGFLGHGGQTLGTESDVGYYPELDLVVVTWANSSEAGTSRGIYHIGHALGLTPTWDEALAEITGAGASSIRALTLEEILGITVNSTGVYIGSTQELKSIPESGEYSITFNADNQLTIMADCNTVMGSYTLGADGAISIELGPSTRVACPEGSIADDFLTVLDAATTLNSISTGDQILVTLSADDGSNVAFAAPAQ